MDSIEALKAKVESFGYWHYEYDLGNGLRTRTAFPGHQTWHDARKRIIQSILDERFGPSLAGRHCLDIACNSGFWSMMLAERGAESIRAIDADPAFIEQAHLVQSVLAARDPRLARPTFEKLDLFELPVEEGRYDVILCLGLMYHLTDPVGAARRLARMSRGTVIVDSSVSRLSGPVLEIGSHDHYIFCDPSEFSFVPSAEALEKILRHAGFTRVERWLPAKAALPYDELRQMLGGVRGWTQSEDILPYEEGSLRALFIASK